MKKLISHILPACASPALQATGLPCSVAQRLCSVLRTQLCKLSLPCSALRAQLCKLSLPCSALCALLCGLAALLFSACQEQGIAPDNQKPDAAFAAYREKQTVVSRAEAEHVEVDGKIRFLEGTKYLIWGFEDQGMGTGKPNYDRQLFEHQPVEGLESPTHYVELSPNNKKKLQGEMHIYGVTNNTENRNTILPAPSAGGYPVFDLAPVDGLSDLWAYYDLCRGYIHYDPVTTVASAFDVPFTHVMSQIKVTVIQEGEVTSTTETDHLTGQETIIYTGTAAFNIFLKNIKLYNEIPTAKYHAINDTYDFTTSADRTTTRRVIYETTEESTLNGSTYVGRKIPLSNDDNPATNIEAISLLMPQRWDSEGKNAYDFTKEPTGSPDLDKFADAVWLELTITGPDAWKFDNEYQESANNNGDVILRLPIKDNTLATNDPLEFLPNHAYNLVVVFHGDNVHVVTLRPLLYPWFDGETEAGEKGDKYQTSDLGSPMVFGSVQWNDRYMGSDFVNPTTLEEFIKATGFYYQKDRSIPFYPSIYKGGYVYDIYGNTHDLEYAEANSGTSVTIDDITYATGGQQVLFRAGGHWTDPTPAQMLNYPKVYPIVSYYLTPYQYYVDGSVDNHESASYPSITYSDGLYNTYIKDIHKISDDKYCTLVDDYYDRTTGEIRSFNKGEQSIDYMMRYIANMDQESNHMWELNRETHPCPPGWRLPTADELFTILPSTPLAGNITFLRDFSVGDGSVGSDDGDNIENGLPGKEIFVQIPYKKPSDLYPPLHTEAMTGPDDTDNYANYYGSGDGDVRKGHMPNARYNKGVNFPEYDPERGDVTQYVISKRHFDAVEFASLDNADKAKIPGDNDAEKQRNYTKYAGQVFYGVPVNPTSGMGVHENFISREWGTIFAIKKQGTVDAYRMRWHVEQVEEGYDIYQLVVDKYKCSEYDKLEYDLSHIGQNDGYYLDYDWDHPESTLYFPITGLVADSNMAQYIPSNTEKNKGAAMVYNYGTETILLTSEHRNYSVNAWWADNQKTELRENWPYAAAYRIKIAGTNAYSLYLYPSMERLAQGGQVRPVRTWR